MSVDHGTSIHAHNNIEASGQAEVIRARVVALLKEHGPMADWELYRVGHASAYDKTSMLARRNDLCKMHIVGTMPGVENRKNPDTEEPGVVWGLIADHSAAVFTPADRLEVRINGSRASVDGTYLDAMSDAEVATAVRELVTEAKAKAAKVLAKVTKGKSHGH